MTVFTNTNKKSRCIYKTKPDNEINSSNSVRCAEIHPITYYISPRKKVDQFSVYIKWRQNSNNFLTCFKRYIPKITSRGVLCYFEVENRAAGKDLEQKAILVIFHIKDSPTDPKQVVVNTF